MKVPKTSRLAGEKLLVVQNEFIKIPPRCTANFPLDFISEKRKKIRKNFDQKREKMKRLKFY